MRVVSLLCHPTSKRMTHPCPTLGILANMHAQAGLTSQVLTWIRTGGNQEEDPVARESA